MIKKLLSPKLQPLWRSAHNYWQGLQIRERFLLSVLAVVVFLSLFWLLIWQPLHVAVAQAEIKRQRQQTEQGWLEQQAALIYQGQQALKASPHRQEVQLTAQELSAFIHTTSNRLNLAVTRIQPQQDGQVIVFDEVVFNNLLQFIEQLARRGAQVESLDVAETATPGVVRVRRLHIRVGD